MSQSKQSKQSAPLTTRKIEYYESETNHSESDSESDFEREEAKPIDFSNDDWKKPRTICILPYNKEPSGTVEYYGDVSDFYTDELKKTYKNVAFPCGRVSKGKYRLHSDIFINKGYPKWLYDLVSRHKIIGVERVCYDDESDDYDSNLPVQDLREQMTHYLFLKQDIPEVVSERL